MHISEVFAKRSTTCSFEFFPPKSKKAAEKLYETISKLEALKPSFVSVTYGAGGSTRELTHDLVVRIHEQTTLEAVPHLTCVCHREEEIRRILKRYARAGISNILALGGDPPRDRANWDRSDDDFRHAEDLVRYINSFSDDTHGPRRSKFGIGVAGFPEGHPDTPNRLLEMDYLKAKVDAGADYVCTQLFFDNRDFYDFCERCEIAGITVPIIAGIMPVTSVSGMIRMAELAAGARFPATLQRDIERCKNDTQAVKAIGVQHATEQCRDLLHHRVRGIHFYTLNKSDATLRIYENLGLRDSAALA